MDKIKVLVVFMIISLGIGLLLYFTDNNYYLIVNSDLILHNVSGKFEKVVDEDKLDGLKVNGYLDNEYNNNLQLRINNDVLKLYKGNQEKDYSNSLLFNNRIKIDNIDVPYEMLDYNDINYINSALQEKDVYLDVSEYDSFKYTIDLDNDSNDEYLYFLSNSNILSINDSDLLTDIVLLRSGNKYAIISLNINGEKGTRVSSLYKIMDINKDKKYEFVISNMGMSDINNCYTMYSYDNGLNKLYTDC